MLSGHRRHPPQVLQNHLVQHTLPDVVGGADLRTFLLVSAAGEVIPGGFHRMRPMQHHGGPAVGAHHQPGVFVLLIHLGGASFVLPYSLNDVPNLLRDQGRVGSLKHQAFLFWMLYMPLVLVGFCAVFHVDGIA